MCFLGVNNFYLEYFQSHFELAFTDQRVDVIFLSLFFVDIIIYIYTFYSFTLCFQQEMEKIAVSEEQ